MANSTSSLSGSAFIVPNVKPEAIDGVFSKTPLINAFRAFGKLVPSAGSSPLKWNYVYGRDGAASAWTENETLSTFGGTLSTQASQDSQFKKVTFGVTDFQLANLANGGLYQDVVALERDKASLALLKSFEDAFAGNGASVGISALIDSTGTAHGINQSTYSGWASIENNCSGSSFASVMYDTYSDLAATNADLSSTVVFMSPTVATQYQSSVASNLRGDYGQPLDIGVNPVGSQLRFNGLPIVVLPSAATTEVYFVDMSVAEIAVHIEPQIKEIAIANLGVNFACVGAMSLILKDRARAAKIINCGQASS